MAVSNIESTDIITDSRSTINNNFSALNTDKVETSVIDTDTTLAANSDTNLPSQKAVKAYVDAQTLVNLEIETTAGVTHSLVTLTNQKAMVWAKGYITITSASATVSLKYNGVTKDTVVAGSAGAGASQNVPFSLIYTETPGADTQDITITTSAGSISQPVILVMKL